jgi:hypothetical protein
VAQRNDEENRTSRGRLRMFLSGGFSVRDTADGIPVLTNRWWDCPPSWLPKYIGRFCWVVFIGMLIATGQLLWFLFRRMQNPWIENTRGMELFESPFLMLFCFLLFSWHRRNSLRVREEIRSLTPASELCSLYGFDEIRLSRLAEERGVKPRLQINGQHYYDPQEFSAVRLLLRPADAPVQETLLRAAGATGAQEDNLPRPVEKVTRL